MQRVRPDVPKRPRVKGVWRLRSGGRRKGFIPACRCSKELRRYTKSQTRLSLWREAQLMFAR